MRPKPDPTRLVLASYPTIVPIQARFADTDVFGHINNVAIAAFYEEARSEFIRQTFEDRVSMGAGAPSRIFVVDVNITYLREARYPGTYSIGVGVIEIGRTSFRVGCAMFEGGMFEDGTAEGESARTGSVGAGTAGNEQCVGLSEAVFVHLTDAGPTPLPAELRATLHGFSLPHPTSPHPTSLHSTSLHPTSEVARAS